MNDDWKNVLKWDNRTEYLPEWLKDVYGISEPWPVPEYSNTTLLAVVTTLTVATVVLVKMIKPKSSKRRKATHASVESEVCSQLDI